MTHMVQEPARNIPVDHTCAVLVCGGGIAGVAAALAAARQGEKVILLEREYALGGLATLGLISIYLPICDGNGRQVSFGIADELLRLTDKYGPEGEKQTPWLRDGSAAEKREARFETHYNPNLYAIELERLLIENGVEILYGTLVCAVDVDKGRIKHVIIENKSGRSAIAVKSVVDATGDADVCHLAGENTALFGQGNVLAGWYYLTADGVHALKMSASSDIPDKYKSSEQIEADKRKRYGGVDGDEISRFMQDSHASTLASFMKSGDYDYKKHALSTITAIPQLRMTRRVAGIYTQDDTEMFTEYADSVGMFSDWRKKGPVYELPFGTLHGSKIRNLLAAGRCISGTDAMWDITRVIPVCAVSGEAAGVAAVMTDDMSKIDISELQRRLRDAGAKIHISELERLTEGNT